LAREYEKKVISSSSAINHHVMKSGAVKIAHTDTDRYRNPANNTNYFTGAARSLVVKPSSIAAGLTSKPGVAAG